MLKRNKELRTPLDLFLASADQLYGPITTLRQDGHAIKSIPWKAFILSDDDWKRADLLINILSPSSVFWERRLANGCYELYHDALQYGLAKLSKYYSKFDQKPAFILTLVLHPYFKLEYIRLLWGRDDEQKAEQARGNKDARNWQDEAQKLVETTVNAIVLEIPSIGTAH
ncbi:hypothetical protein JOM56_012861 [Amanita muscaria]